MLLCGAKISHPHFSAMRDEDDDVTTTYKWEHGLQQSWENVQEDEYGHLSNDPTREYERDRKRAQKSREQRVTSSIRRGLIRYMVVAIDTSLSANENDFWPSRLHVTKFALKQFISEFYDQNPISQLAFAVTRERTAEKISELSGSKKGHIKPLDDLCRCEGSASLQNTLLRAISILKYTPAYGHKELLIVYSSLGSCDSSNIQNTIDDCNRSNLRVSIICIVAEVYICKKICEETGGSFSVAVDANHLKTLVTKHAIPPPQMKNRIQTSANFIYMGFPSKEFNNYASYSFEGRAISLSTSSYICPRCFARTTDIPAECVVCSLQLNSSPHIARSHHHLFPIGNFKEIEENAVSNDSNTRDNSRCFGCNEMLTANSLRLQCLGCACIYCIECDVFIHDSLHNCPGCHI